MGVGEKEKAPLGAFITNTFQNHYAITMVNEPST